MVAMSATAQTAQHAVASPDGNLLLSFSLTDEGVPTYKIIPICKSRCIFLIKLMSMGKNKMPVIDVHVAYFSQHIKIKNHLIHLSITVTSYT